MSIKNIHELNKDETKYKQTKVGKLRKADLSRYAIAFNSGNQNECQKLFEKYPNDSRFAQHLQYGKTIKTQKLSEVEDEYSNERKQFVPVEYVRFVNLLEVGKIEQAKRWVKILPKDNKYRKKLIRLLPYI